MSRSSHDRATAPASHRVWPAPAHAPRPPHCSPEFAAATPATPHPSCHEIVPASDAPAAMFAAQYPTARAALDALAQCAIWPANTSKTETAGTCRPPSTQRILATRPLAICLLRQSMTQILAEWFVECEAILRAA